jgi:hypothetical protein
MRYEDHDYQAYMLRVWRTTYKGQWQWHASLESPHTGERQSFTSLEQCFTFLRERYGGPAASMPEVGKELEHKKSGAE